MTKIQNILLVLFLASTTLAAPKQRHHHHRPTGTGTGTGHGKPSRSTSAPYGYGNSTAVGPTGTGVVWPTGYSTYIPLPVSSSEEAAAKALTSGPVKSFAPSTFSISFGHGSHTSSAGHFSPTGIYSTEYPTGTADSSSVSYPYKHASHSKWTSVMVSPSSSSRTTSTNVTSVVASSSSSKAYTPSSSATSVVASSSSSKAYTRSSSITSVAASSSSSKAYTPSPSTTVKIASSSSSAAYIPSSSSVKFSTSSSAVKLPSSSSAAYTPSSSMAASSTSSAAAATATLVDHSTSLSGSKRGLVYNQAAWLAPFANAVEPLSWAYNWAASSSGLSSNYKFVPMLHDLGGNLASFVASAKAGFGEVDAIMAFNEPDQPAIYGGSDISPPDAATNYNIYMKPLRTQYPNAQLGAPSVSNGNTTSPRLLGMQWLAPFFEACSDCPIDFVPLHWYGWTGGSATDQAKVFQQYITTATAEIAVMAKRPMKIWVTELAAEPKVDANMNKAFMDIVLPWLDAAPMVDRYSYFMVDPGMLIASPTSLSASGSRYIGIKS